ncbi:MAG TPA: zinc ribbon domain-containing protein [Roseiflexaceae bacterium]|nr:zinc ribbon domain-containing protein [Roseiflexaceae bacterium]
MVERICPACQQANPVNDRFCGKCGAQMERQLPARIADTRLTIAGRNLPITWQQLGKTVALSAAALAADVGMAWLRRRLEAGPSAAPSTLTRSGPIASEPAAQGRSAGSIVTIISQRVIEVWDSGDGKRQINEKHIWRRIEE